MQLLLIVMTCVYIDHHAGADAVQGSDADDHLENGNFLNVRIAYNLLIVHVHAQIRCVTE